MKCILDHYHTIFQVSFRCFVQVLVIVQNLLLESARTAMPSILCCHSMATIEGVGENTGH